MLFRRITDERSMFGTAPADFHFTRVLDAGPVHCSRWLSHSINVLKAEHLRQPCPKEVKERWQNVQPATFCLPPIQLDWAGVSHETISATQINQIRRLSVDKSN